MQCSTVFNVLTIFLKKKKKEERIKVTWRNYLPVEEKQEDNILKGTWTQNKILRHHQHGLWGCETLSAIVADWIFLKWLTGVNSPEVFSDPLFNKRQEPPSALPARNELDFAWWGARSNLTAPSVPTEDMRAQPKFLCLKVWWQTQEVSETGWKSPTVFMWQPMWYCNHSYTVYKYKELCHLKRLK